MHTTWACEWSSNSERYTQLLHMYTQCQAVFTHNSGLQNHFGSSILLQVLSQHMKGGRPVLEGIAHATPKRWEKLQKPRRRISYLTWTAAACVQYTSGAPGLMAGRCVRERACSARAKAEGMGAALPRRPPRQGRHALIQTGKPESTPAEQCTTRHMRGGNKLLQPLAVCAQHRSWLWPRLGLVRQVCAAEHAAGRPKGAAAASPAPAAPPCQRGAGAARAQPPTHYPRKQNLAPERPVGQPVDELRGRRQELLRHRYRDGGRRRRGRRCGRRVGRCGGHRSGSSFVGSRLRRRRERLGSHCRNCGGWRCYRRRRERRGRSRGRAGGRHCRGCDGGGCRFYRGGRGRCGLGRSLLHRGRGCGGQRGGHLHVGGKGGSLGREHVARQDAIGLAAVAEQRRCGRQRGRRLRRSLSPRVSN